MQRTNRDPELARTLAELAPGTLLREAIERVMHAHRGTLLVVGFGDDVEAISSGGFAIDATATAQRIAELAKMDGAIILDDKAGRILRANVHLVPDPKIETSETGTRHRTAERVARQTGRPVVAVSESMSTINVYLGGVRHTLEEVGLLLFRANQALATLERYRARLSEHLDVLTDHELSGTASVRDAVICLQRAEMLTRIGDEVAGYATELGSEGRLVRLQLDELVSGADVRALLIRDYVTEQDRDPADVLEQLSELSSDELLDTERVAALLTSDDKALDRVVEPAGWRLLARVPRLPEAVAVRLVSRYATVRQLVRAEVDDLAQTDGVGETRARRVRDTLNQIATLSS